MYSYRKENDYLIISNREKCKKILQKQERSTEDIIDFLISLHLVLEVGLHTFYRHIILFQIKKKLSLIDIAQNLDDVGFGHLTTLFFYLPNFDFKGNENQAKEFHDAIRVIKNFCETRNKLLHGHMIGEIASEEKGREVSKAYKLVTEEHMRNQIKRFKFIIDAISFYYDHLEIPMSPDYKKEYLRYDFLSTEASFIEKTKE